MTASFFGNGTRSEFWVMDTGAATGAMLVRSREHSCFVSFGVGVGHAFSH